ncbi:PTS sugar transporter subunit IIB [Liquorilactobacillus mali]|uniref:PTS system cellobiose-specific transporter subunit IIB n=1 Tax=Liquorilactobacillus mali KCTC 3596 = DSM 20444 TaxID=1046596 RepID=J0UPQ6_9LACO|nr:PTS sugar transporter subunit IIB [Liquorilactobacillus mali]EJE97532.1 PTS system cellobiose-specific transporter subunit IIB [Liquorilactobacillus mali KCTC 3596 = DSM 20444]KRN11224.1 PTS system cellobiose-specific transporter subunit IIB [Liquorilactobacillus mali KCTC 3596 = DSM 20444]MDV7757712.1 PTS sugar transporter subunit IIB [Liquorilactobacillus mali]QFQ73784.1 PTS sugar transporter subunit IIB [Liquorilactobacillus mali]
MSEKTIMLCCAAGMSTSMLVAKMQTAAKEQGKEYDIFAVSASEIDQKLVEKEIDVVLLGPQIRYMKNDIEKKLVDKKIPMDVIDMQSYGMMKGAKVLEQAEGLMA